MVAQPIQYNNLSNFVTSSSQAFNSCLSALIAKINSVSKNSMLCFSMIPLGYYLNRGVDYLNFRSFLNNEYRLVQCKKLLGKARDEEFPLEKTLKDCEAQVKLLPDKEFKNHKKDILLKISSLYAKNNNLEKSYDIIESLLLEDNLTLSDIIFITSEGSQLFAFNKFKSILTCIPIRRYIERSSDDLSSFLNNINALLELAEIFNSNTNTRIFYEIRAEEFVNNKSKDHLERIIGFCNLASHFFKIENEERAFFSINNAQKLLHNLSPQTGLIEAHLILADTLRSFKQPIPEGQSLDEIDKVTKILENQQSATIIEKLEALENFISKINSKTDSNISFIVTKPLVEIVLNNYSPSDNSNEDLITRFLNKINSDREMDLRSKVKILVFLSSFYNSQKITKKIITVLEKLYPGYPDSRSFLGKTILNLYYEIDLKKKSETFFNNHYLPTFQDGLKSLKPFAQITSLAEDLKGIHCCFPQHKKTQLELAEKILSESEKSLSLTEKAKAYVAIATGYSEFDLEKSEQIFQNLTKNVSTEVKILPPTIFMASVLMFSAMYFKNQTTLFLHFGLFALHKAVIWLR